MKYCRNCGNEVDDNTIYCPLCGTCCEGNKASTTPVHVNKRVNNTESVTTNNNDVTTNNVNETNSNEEHFTGGSNFNNTNSAVNNVNRQTNINEENKSLRGGGVGFALTFFLSLLGFILCLVLGDKKCKKASIITFCVVVGFNVLLFIVLIAMGLASGSSSAGGSYDDYYTYYTMF